MKTQNHKKYKKDILTLLENYLKNNNRVELIEGLTAIENIYIANRDTNKRLWFRFFKNDALATTIRNIENNLEYNCMTNYKYLVECFQISINTKELQIYFS